MRRFEAYSYRRDKKSKIYAYEQKNTDESIADAKMPLRMTWFASSWICRSTNRAGEI
jgi:hypothetical protein